MRDNCMLNDAYHKKQIQYSNNNAKINKNSNNLTIYQKVTKIIRKQQNNKNFFSTNNDNNFFTVINIWDNKIEKIPKKRLKQQKLLTCY